MKVEHCTIKSSDDAFKTWSHELHLSEHDRKTLLSHAWLSSNHISAAQTLLKSMYPNQNGLKDTIYLFDKLKWESNIEKFVQIINIDGYHWAVVSNKFSLEVNTVQVYDSLMLDSSDSVIEQIYTILKCSESSFKIQLMNVQLQKLPDSCGLFAIAMAQDLCRNKDPCYRSYEEGLMRNHLAKCFQEKQLTKFPRDVKPRSFHRQIIMVKEVLVYCICRYSDDTTHFGDMAMCDSCNEWFHQECLNIPKEEFARMKERENEDFICPFCSEL